MSEADQAQLAAGGLVPTSTKLGKGDVVDTVVARAYRHAVLPGRTVVRLVAESVIAGDDLEMATLGFAAGEDRGAVAKERKRPLGFPGWALVHDPKNARYALDVVKELKKVARRVKSKPGAAKEGFDKIAAALAKTVPHFLPSFYEQVGRLFLEHGAASYAATYFGKAREAEAVHALAVDEQHRVDGFLEFALAGAVTTKALSQYAKELAKHHAPADAYAHFRKLAVQRTLGGMPPWSGMGADLQRLAKAAKLDVAAEDRAVIAEIMGSPAINGAAAEFWRVYHDAIRDLATGDAAVRATLLNLFPKGATYSRELDLAWLDLVEETGGMTALVEGDPVVQPIGGRAAWFDKLVQHLGRYWEDRSQPVRTFEILRRLAPKLVADGVPIRCLTRYNQIDLDVCELALELGVPVSLVNDARRAWVSSRFNLDEWAKDADKPEHGRDPVRIAAHPQLGLILVKAVDDALGRDAFDRVSAGMAGFLAAKRAWLEQQLTWAETGGLPVVTETLERIDKKAKATLFADLPDLHARFAALDVAPALARSLQIGMIDELGWPALEAVMAELSVDQTVVTVHGGPPVLVCATKTKLVAVGAAGRLGEHDLVVPAKHELVTARFIGGQFLVVLKEGSTAKGYWSGNPLDVFTAPDVSVYGFKGLSTRAAIMSDGAWLEGATPIRVGDRVLPVGHDLRAYDGTTAWIAEPGDNTKWREVSPTGDKGRASWPAAIERAIDSGIDDGAGDGWRVDATSSYVLPIGDRIVGVAALFRMNGEPPRVTHRKLVVLDGPAWSGETATSTTGLLSLPGGEPRVLSLYSAYGAGAQTTIWDPTLQQRGSIVAWKDRDFSRAQAAPLPHVFWHHYSIRDEAGSRRLRTISADDAAKLVAAIPVDASGLIPSGIPDEPIAKVLPEISSQQVRNGITGFAIVAVKAQRQHDRLVAERAPAMAAARVAAQPFSDVVVNTALENWTERSWNKTGATWRQIAAVGEWLADEDRSNRYVHELPNVGEVHLDWFPLIPVYSALAFAALAIGTPAEHRAPLAATFTHLARAFPQGDKLRVYGLDGAHRFPGGSHDGVDARWHDGNAYVVRKRGYSEMYRVIEYAPTGTFKAPPAGKIYDELRPTGAGLSADVARELEAAIAAGKTTWSAAAALRLAVATGLSPSAAAYLWAGMPNLHDRSANFLAKDLREQLGLKATQAALGRDAMTTIRDDKRRQALDACARAGVAAMLDGSAVDALAAAWVRHVGKRVAVPESLIAEADALNVTGQPAHWLSVFAAPDESPLLAADGCFAFERGADVVRTGSAEPLVGQDKLADAPPAFDGNVLTAAIHYLPFLYAELPAGDELRVAAARSHELLLARLANPALWLDAGAYYLGTDEQATVERLLDGLGGQALANLHETVRGVQIPGAAILYMKSRVRLALHPATLDAKAMPLVDKVVATLSTYENSIYGALKYARSPGLAQMMARIRDTPVVAGGWEQNPLASAPALASRVAKKLGVPQNAAALYLQYLVLLWPTPKNLIMWNGWKPMQLAEAQAALVAKDLVVEAKRERAQRGHFLPGGWEAQKSPHPPMESWKLAFYGVRDATGAPRALHRSFLALAPFHAMFEAAWQRIEDDDTPRYDEVKR